MNYKVINLEHKFGLFKEQWKPKVIAEMNDYPFKIVKIEAEKEVKLMLIEPRGVHNMGHENSDITVQNDVWI
ncbi:MAG: hypothetical protein ACRCYY_00870 [Trueperaceae bacterium]